MPERNLLLKNVLGNFPGGISVLDRDLRVVFTNPAARDVLGLSDGALAQEPLFEDVLRFLLDPTASGGDDIAEQVRTHLDCAKSRTVHLFSWRRADGTTIEICSAPIADGGFVTTYTDITARMRTEALFKGQADVLQLIAQGTPLAKVLEQLMHLIEGQLTGIVSSVLLLDADGLHLRHGAAPSLDPAYCALVDGIAIGPNVGSCGTAAYGKAPVIVADIMSNPLWADFKDLVAPYGLRSCWSTPIFSPSGEVLGTFAMYSRSVRVPSLEEEHLVEVATRIAGIAIERKRTEDRIFHMARHDALTGLLNRGSLAPCVQQAITSAQDTGMQMSLVFVDLDKFKVVNDSMGHGVGDELLKVVATRLRAVAGEAASVIRYGGDEFIVVLADVPPSGDVTGHVVARIKAALGEPVILGGRNLAISCSIGTASYPADGQDLEALLTAADGNMYRSKQNETSLETEPAVSRSCLEDEHEASPAELLRGAA